MLNITKYCEMLLNVVKSCSFLLKGVNRRSVDGHLLPQSAASLRVEPMDAELDVYLLRGATRLLHGRSVRCPRRRLSLCAHRLVLRHVRHGLEAPVSNTGESSSVLPSRGLLPRNKVRQIIKMDAKDVERYVLCYGNITASV